MLHHANGCIKHTTVRPSPGVRTVSRHEGLEVLECLGRLIQQSLRVRNVRYV